MRLDKLTVKQIAEIDSCTKCGNCLDLCSAVQGSGQTDISPAKKIKMLKGAISNEYGLLSKLFKRKISEKDIEKISKAAFACTMCARCEVNCHIDIKLQDMWLKLRDILVSEGKYPQVLDSVKERLLKARNVSFDTNEGRADWVRQMPNIPEDLFVKEKMDVAYFVGCVSSFSPRVFKIPRAIIQLLASAKVDFGLLGDEEWCCGFPLLTSGFSSEFLEFAEHNIEAINKSKAKYLITSCPSCYHMWHNTYAKIKPGIRMDFEVLHAVQYFNMLIKEGRLDLKEVNKKVTYHDPCDLGRNSKVYEEPREIIKAIPGVEFIELPSSREYATCCGGGGNVESIDVELSESIAKIKAQEIIDSQAEIIVTACQQCVRTIMNALKKQRSKIKVMDIAELLLMSISE
jgi:heterodisulfide reductase subunit D